MRIRKCIALGGAILVFFGCLMTYKMADYTLFLSEESIRPFHSRDSSPKKVFKPAEELAQIVSSKVINLEQNVNTSPLRPECKRDSSDVCEIQMFDVYKKLTFDNVDGGVWKQGWNVETDPAKWNSQNKLKVFIVPHSHNDPGWLKSFEDYYISETRNILNNMLKQLTADPQKKFIWAEISYFSLWWDELSEGDQEKVRRLIKAGQLEIVTGGWVMNDEANTHIYSMITQLTEGHQWMKANINVYPRNGWTIDPFGMSPVMAYLLKQMGLENLVIHRVHYSVKKYLASTKNLEFRWRQFWDEEGSTDLLTHMTPFYSYDIPHTCGPDPKICCQFDFKRLPGSGMSCPWKEPPKLITPKNVAYRAQLLLDQYRKKSELYRTNVILVPLGDDFRYQDFLEWNNQFGNYYKILDYINNNPKLHAEVKFGTLAEFFDALTKEAKVESFPSLIGDFFTYADRDDHYWSGYYTSRPFYKRMDRILIGYHRAAEIIFALGWSAKGFGDTHWLLKPQTGFAKMLRETRRNLGLFQHHDGITGTARDHVMEDYARKMMNAINYSRHIIQQVSTFFLSSLKEGNGFDTEKIYFDFDDHRQIFNYTPTKKVLNLNEGKTKSLVFFNSLAYKRNEMVSVYVSDPYVEVYDSKGNSILCQTSPVFSQDAVMDDSRFEISFMVEVPALGLASYRIKMKFWEKPNRKYLDKNTFSKLKIFNSLGPITHSRGFQNYGKGDVKEFSIENQKFSVTIGENGLLKSITNKNTLEFTPVQLHFISYEAKKGRERSGAYIFLPDGEAKIVKIEKPLIRVYEGPIFSKVEVKLNNMKHFLYLYNDLSVENKGINLEIVNIVDISREVNYELGMRITSHIKSGSEFHTDLNGFQMMKRLRYSKLPIQGNFYPMPTASFIEDEKLRLTVVSAQPLGVSSLKEGEIEILQDRRLNQDDNRGLGQGVLDNKPTPNIFRILLEKRSENCNIVSPLLSINSYASSQSLLNPLVKMIWKSDDENEIKGSFSPVAKDLGVDLHLLSVRTFNEEEETPKAGLVFHRPHLDSCFSDSLVPSDGVINLHSFLPHHFGDDLTKTSLSFLKEEQKLKKNEDKYICHMDFLALTIS